MVNQHESKVKARQPQEWTTEIGAKQRKQNFSVIFDYGYKISKLIQLSHITQKKTSGQTALKKKVSVKSFSSNSKTALNSWTKSVRDTSSKGSFLELCTPQVQWLKFNSSPEKGSYWPQ